MRCKRLRAIVAGAMMMALLTACSTEDGTPTPPEMTPMPTALVATPSVTGPRTEFTDTTTIPASGARGQPAQAVTRQEPTSTATSANKLADEFGCQWIMDTYRPMETLGRDAAIMHVANSMSLARNDLSYIGSGDAAAAVRACETPISAGGTKARPTQNMTRQEPASTATSANKLANEFGCQWIMDTYRPMEMLGRDAAIMHVANSMSLARNDLSYIGSGDAAAAVRACESLGHR